MVSTMGAPCSSAVAEHMKQELAVQKSRHRKDFAAGWASNPLVGMEEHPLLNCPNCHYSHSMPAGSDRHLVRRLEGSERC
jgi:hypothetical protein